MGIGESLDSEGPGVEGNGQAAAAKNPKLDFWASQQPEILINQETGKPKTFVEVKRDLKETKEQLDMKVN